MIAVLLYALLAAIGLGGTISLPITLPPNKLANDFYIEATINEANESDGNEAIHAVPLPFIMRLDTAHE